MIPLLADATVASGEVAIPGWAVISALVTVVLAFVALGRLLLAEKDSKLALAREVGKDYSADREKTNAILVDLGTKVTRVAEGLETALNERDKIVEDGMKAINEVKSELARLVERLSRERTP